MFWTCCTAEQGGRIVSSSTELIQWSCSGFLCIEMKRAVQYLTEQVMIVWLLPADVWHHMKVYQCWACLKNTVMVGCCGQLNYIYTRQHGCQMWLLTRRGALHIEVRSFGVTTVEGVFFMIVAVIFRSTRFLNGAIMELHKCYCYYYFFFSDI